MSEVTYEDRNIELCKIKSIDDEFGCSITMTNGWSMVFDKELRDKIEVGDHFILEKKGFNRITGFMLLSLDGGEWLWHHSDQDIEALEAEWKAKDRERRQKFIDENRDDMLAREAKLPKVLQERLQNFREHGGHEFELGGWAYELIVCELMFAYHESDGEESDTIKGMAQLYGTSGNQHDYAQTFAKLMGTEREHELAGSPSALTPITGDPDYSDAGAN